MPENRRIRYAIVVERAGDTVSASVPDLPGCIATTATIADASHFHIDGLRADGEPVPEPTTPVDPPRARSLTEGDDPFAAFVEWAGEADEAAYADL